MPRLNVRFWSCVSMAALVGVIVTFSASGQDPAESQPKSDPKSVEKADMKSDEMPKTDAKPKAKDESEAVTKTDRDWRRVTDQEWQRMLTRAQFLVTRRKETEQPFSGKYSTSHASGTYLCVCCKAELFSSRTKFDSGTGWPSFWQPIDLRAVAQAPDYSEPEPRVEVMCRRCGAHLGHVFDDGPDPSGLRFCINSLALDFKAAAGPGTSAKTKTKTKAKAKVKTKAKSTKVTAAPRKAQPNDSDPTPDSNRGAESGQAESSTPQ